MIKIKKRRELLNIYISGFILLFAGVGFLIQLNYYGAFLILGGLTIVTSEKGILADGKNKRLKYYIRVLFMEFGNWQDYSNLKLIVLTKTRVSQQVNAASLSGNYSDTFTKLTFINANNKAEAIYSDKKSKILPFVKYVAKAFTVDILDNTEGEPIRIKYSELD
jgi:hypothetical protein